jgi:CheY-like chemotaxis protein
MGAGPVQGQGPATNLPDGQPSPDEVAPDLAPYLARLAHDLRNPLAALQVANQLLRDAADDPAAVRRLVDGMAQLLRDLNQVLDELVHAPLVPREPTDPRLMHVPPAPATGTRRVLVVDDLVDAAEGQAALLRLAGHEVRVVHDGSEALRVAAAFRPDVVILDIGLPGLDGLSVARALRSQPGTASVLLVVLSGYATPPAWGPDVDVDHYLVKPADPDLIQGLVDGAPRSDAS